MMEISVYCIFKLHCVLEGPHDPLKTSVAAWFAGSTHTTCEPSIVCVTGSLNPCLGLSENSGTCQQENLQRNNYIVETLTNPPQFMTLKIGLGVSN